MSISAVIVTYNNADTIRACLSSLTWVDEIVIADLGSSDETLAICQAFTSAIHHLPWTPYVETVRNDAIALARHPWVLVMDPDERVSPVLAVQLRRIVAADAVDAVCVPRWDMAFGKRRVDRRSRELHVRFFRRGVLVWPRAIHSHPKLDGLRVQVLPIQGEAYLLHETWRTVAEVREKIKRYTPIEAMWRYRSGHRYTLWRHLDEVLREVARWFVFGGWRNGTAGLLRLLFIVRYRFDVGRHLRRLGRQDQQGDLALSGSGQDVLLVSGDERPAGSVTAG